MILPYLDSVGLMGALLVVGQWALGIGHWALGIGHWAIFGGEKGKGKREKAWK